MLKDDIKAIYETAIYENLPDYAVKRALGQLEDRGGRLIVVAIGKAAWQMASVACGILGSRVDSGIVITKHSHSKGDIYPLEIYEASHPVPDNDCIEATKRALDMTGDLCENDTVLFLVSGGGSALFEHVDCTVQELKSLTEELLSSGASIGEINAVRKHISNVKGGRFARHVYPARVFAIALSDVIGNDIGTIASGPACADTTSVEDALGVIKKYNINLTDKMRALISRETPKEVTNSTHIVSGSVNQLCKSAYNKASELGYSPQMLSNEITGEAREVGTLIGQVTRYYASANKKIALIAGGETVVRLKGSGKGGRNQELALSAAREIYAIPNVIICSVGSDGTDGPTDAAGGIVDGETWLTVEKSGKSPEEYLNNNDSYNALRLADGLVVTGPTGTNVNDLIIALVEPRRTK